MVHGALERERRKEDLVAWAIGWLVAPHVKRPPAIEKILGREPLSTQMAARRWKKAKGKEA